MGARHILQDGVIAGREGNPRILDPPNSYLAGVIPLLPSAPCAR